MEKKLQLNRWVTTTTGSQLSQHKDYNFTDFTKFAKSAGIGSDKLYDYVKYSINNSMINPTIIEERTMNMVAIDVFSRLIADRIIFLGTGIDDDVSNIINAQLLYLNSVDTQSDIKLFINSGGGSIISGLAIYDTMNFIEADVSTYCLGLSASMAAVLLSSGAKGKRHSLPNSMVMIHQASTASDYCQNADFQIKAKLIDQLETKIFNIMAENTGKSFEQIKADCNRDNWLMADEAKEYGLIDNIISKIK